MVKKSILKPASISFLFLLILALAFYAYFQSNYSQTALSRRIDSQQGFKIINQHQDISVRFRIEPKYIPRKQGDIYNLHKVIYNDHNTKIFLETVALYNPPKNTENVYIELKFEPKFHANGGDFVTPFIYEEDHSFASVMFQPKYFMDDGKEIIINDGNGMKDVFFTPNQTSGIQLGLTLDYKGFNLVEYSRQ